MYGSLCRSYISPSSNNDCCMLSINTSGHLTTLKSRRDRITHSAVLCGITGRAYVRTVPESHHVSIRITLYQEFKNGNQTLHYPARLYQLILKAKSSQTWLILLLRTGMLCQHIARDRDIKSIESVNGDGHNRVHASPSAHYHTSTCQRSSQAVTTGKFHGAEYM
jgi:hypothetical protein